MRIVAKILVVVILELSRSLLNPVKVEAQELERPFRTILVLKKPDNVVLKKLSDNFKAGINNQTPRSSDMVDRIKLQSNASYFNMANMFLLTSKLKYDVSSRMHLQGTLFLG